MTLVSVGDAPSDDGLPPVEPVIQVALNDTIPTVRGRRNLERRRADGVRDPFDVWPQQPVPELLELELNVAVTYEPAHFQALFERTNPYVVASRFLRPRRERDRPVEDVIRMGEDDPLAIRTIAALGTLSSVAQVLADAVKAPSQPIAFATRQAADPRACPRPLLSPLCPAKERQ